MSIVDMRVDFFDLPFLRCVLCKRSQMLTIRTCQLLLAMLGLGQGLPAADALNCNCILAGPLFALAWKKSHSLVAMADPPSDAAGGSGADGIKVMCLS